MIAERLAFDRGVHLRGTPLWLDAERKQKHCILTGILGALPARHERGLVSASLGDRLVRAGYQGHLLPSPFGRWVGLGGQQVQLVDVQGPLGEAGALVVAGHDRILYTGLMPACEVGWPQADVLVALTPALDGQGTLLAPLARALAEQLGASSQPAAIQVDDIGAAAALAQALVDIGVDARPLGLLQKLLGTKTPAPVTLAAVGGLVPQKARLIFIDTGRGLRPNQAPDITLRLRYWADKAALVQAVKQSGARHVLLVGTSKFSMDLPDCQVTHAFWTRARQLSLTS